MAGPELVMRSATSTRSVFRGANAPETLGKGQEEEETGDTAEAETGTGGGGRTSQGEGRGVEGEEDDCNLASVLRERLWQSTAARRPLGMQKGTCGWKARRQGKEPLSAPGLGQAGSASLG